MFADFKPCVRKGVLVPELGELKEIVGVDVGEDLEVADLVIADPVAVLALNVGEEFAVFPPACFSGIEF